MERNFKKIALGLIALMATVMVAFSGAVEPQRHEGLRVRLVAAGIADYVDPSTQDLPNCDTDAVRIAQALADAGVLHPESVVLLNDEATADRIREEIARAVSEATEDEIVMVFYSGHGSYEQGTWEPAEAMDDFDETIAPNGGQITDDEMATLLSGGRAALTILALDSCYSGGFMEIASQNPRTLGLFTCLESTPSGTYPEQDAGGYLSFFLYEALANGSATVGEVVAHIDSRWNEVAPAYPAGETTLAEQTQVITFSPDVYADDVIR